MDEVFSALAHPKRRGILLELFYEGQSTITHFKQDFNIKTGTLYHHLNILRKHGLIEQNDQKLYKLTDKGLECIEPLFDGKEGEFQKIKNNYLTPNNTDVHNDNEKRFNINYKYSLFEKIDSFLVFLFNHVKLIMALNLLVILCLEFFLAYLKLGLIGHHFIDTSNVLITLFSSSSTIFLTLILLYSYPRIMNRKEPITLEFFMLGLSLFIPVFLFTGLFVILVSLQQQLLISKGLIVFSEFLNQIFWLFWVYIIFRIINGLDYLKALLGSFIVNYIWLTLILMI